VLVLLLERRPDRLGERLPDVPAEEFARRPVQHRGRPLVDVREPPLLVEGEERVVDARENLAEFGPYLVALALQVPFLFFELGDVLGGDDGPLDPLPLGDGCHVERHPLSLPVGKFDLTLPVSDGVARLEDAPVRALVDRDRVARLVVDGEAVDPVLVRRGPEPPVEAAVRRLHLAGGVDDGDAGRRRLENPPGEVPLLAEPLFVLAPVGHVPCHLQVPLDVAVLVADRRDRDVRPEARPVGPDAPALVLCRPLLGRVGQVRLRDAGLAVGLGVERREVLAQDLPGFVALDPLGALVPGPDPPLGVQPENGVLLDGVDQRLERRPVTRPFCRRTAG
jgi:hypothetical protein